MKKLILILAFFVSILNGRSQQMMQFSQYLYNPYSINPSVAAIDDRISILGLHRSQWVGIEGAPTTQTFTITAPIADKLGAGIFLFNDMIGARRFSGALAGVSYRIKTSAGSLGFGVRGGVYSMKILSDKVNYLQQGDPGIVNGEMQIVPDFDAGFDYYSETFFFGISATNLNEAKIKLNNNSTLESGTTLKRHYYGIIGTKIKLSDNLKLRISTLGKYVIDTPMNFDANAGVIYRDRVHFSVTYRTSGMIAALAEFYATDKLRFGYSFDYTTTILKQFSTVGSHEIFIGIDLYKKSRPMVTPRFL